MYLKTGFSTHQGRRLVSGSAKATQGHRGLIARFPSLITQNQKKFTTPLEADIPWRDMQYLTSLQTTSRVRPSVPKKVLGEPRFALVQPIGEPEFAFRVIVNYGLESGDPESFRSTQTGGNGDGAILDDYS